MSNRKVVLTADELWDIGLSHDRSADEAKNWKEISDKEKVIVTYAKDGSVASVVCRGNEYLDEIRPLPMAWLEALGELEKLPSKIERERMKFRVAADLIGDIHTLTQCHALPAPPEGELGTEEWFSCNSGGSGGGDIHEPMVRAFRAVAEGKTWIEAGRPFFDSVIEMLREWALDTYYPNGCPLCSEQTGDPDEDLASALEALADRIRDRSKRRQDPPNGEEKG